MFRFTRPLFTAVTKRSTGIVGLKVHHDPLPELKKTYEATLQTLSAIPQTSVYRQGTEALTLHKLKVLERANGDIAAVEKELDEGQIEESLDIAQDELGVANKMLEWKAWEPLEEKPEPGQWQYFGKEATASTSS
ncbi:NADH2 dehydrogenase [Lentinus tigrinus ALCF2SS1-7]|uniref:NADH2 dehydrogenase n=1 Tax=Lentinus tigrinus ALCF2SS1-7 TaxID=1328758 RepID=UPI001165EE93|nr:NADH2 dehydrogenase [Lentinus tigrinus ALCF2SS1-7]